MPRHPMVRKYYVFPSNFARRFRYNEQALVYSGLLAGSAVFAAETLAKIVQRRAGRRTDPDEVFSACVHAYPEPPAQ
jgi:hypothetical protein